MSTWKQRRKQTDINAISRQDVAYIRVSTAIQADAYGLDMQRDGIVAFAGVMGEKIDSWYVDTDSGAEEQRQNLIRL